MKSVKLVSTKLHYAKRYNWIDDLKGYHSRGYKLAAGIDKNGYWLKIIND